MQSVVIYTICSCLFHSTHVLCHMSGHLNASFNLVIQQNLNLLLTQEGWQVASEFMDHHQLSFCVSILDYQSESLLSTLAKTYEFLVNTS